MKLRDAIQKYISWKSTYTTKAFADYPRTLRRFFQHTQKDLERLELEDVAGFRLALRDKYHLSDNTIAQSLIVIKNFIKFYREQGIGKINPTQIRISKNFVVKSHTPITVQEFKKMDRCLGDSFEDLRRKVAIHLLWFSGVRVSELCDIDIAQLEKCRCYIKNKKNANCRWIFWPKETQDLIDRYLRIRLSLSSDRALLVGSSNNSLRRITARSIQRWIKEISTRAGINKKLSPHSFRHGRSQFIKMNGGDIHDVAIVLGHKNIQSTGTYLKFSPKALEKRVKRWL